MLKWRVVLYVVRRNSSQTDNDIPRGGYPTKVLPRKYLTFLFQSNVMKKNCKEKAKFSRFFTWSHYLIGKNDLNLDVCVGKKLKECFKNIYPCVGMDMGNLEVTVSMLVSSKGVDDHDSCASLAEASNNGKGSWIASFNSLNGFRF